eukprot:378410_1
MFFNRMASFLLVLAMIQNILVVLSHESTTLNTYIQQWVTPSLKFPKSDRNMICGYNDTESPDIITLIGGHTLSETVYQYNITANIIYQLPDLNIMSSSYPNGAVTINNLVYFSNRKSDAIKDNLFIYSISTNQVIQEGNTYPKSHAVIKECFATDGMETIYLIGGQNTDGTSTKRTVQYNIQTHIWTDFGTLITNRHYTGCIYNRFDDSIYVFGGRINYWATATVLQSNTIASIEIYNTSNYTNTSNQWVMLDGIYLTSLVAELNTFMINSNTIAIVGGENVNFCNLYSIDTPQINLCANMDITANKHCGVYVNNMQFQRYYAFGFVSQDVPVSYDIKFAVIGPFDINFTALTSTVYTGQRIPINIDIREEYARFHAMLVCDELHIQYKLNRAMNQCILCNDIECVNCSIGILPIYDKPLPHPQTVLCENMISNNITTTIDDYYNYDLGYNCSAVHIPNDIKLDCGYFGITATECINKGCCWVEIENNPMDDPWCFYGNQTKIPTEVVQTVVVNDENNFNIEYLQQYFELDISTKIGITFVVSINDLFMFSYDELYSINLMFMSNNNAFEPMNSTLNIQLSGKQTVKQCIMFNNDCNLGIDIRPMIHSDFKENKISTSVYISSVFDNFIIYPRNFSFISVEQYLTFGILSNEIFPGQSISIVINSSFIFIDGLYTFDVISDSDKELKINTHLHITVSNGTATKCESCDTNNNSSNCIDCIEGIIPIIDSRFINSNNSLFHLHLIPTANITIYPINGVNIHLTLCQRGYGIDSTTCANCKKCPHGEYQFSDSILPCYSCQTQANNDYLNGVDCQGGDTVIISYNYWIAALSNNYKLRPFIDISINDTIYCALCAPGFCCNSLYGCNYIQSINDSHGTICAFGRDTASVYCGKCVEGKSELFSSTNCGICNHTNYLLIIVVIFVLFVPCTLYIVYFAATPSYDNGNLKQIKQILNTLIFDILIYYFQSLSIILASKGFFVSNWIIFLFSVFNLQPSNMMNSDSNSGYCIIPNLTCIQKLLIELIYPTLYIPTLIIIGLITTYTPLKKIKTLFM